jgi:predicted DNA-binding transcriptional regulator AlpA
MTLKRRVRPPAASEYLGMSESWLAKRRMKGDPPRYLKLGGRSIAYDLSDLDDFIAASRRNSTSEYPLPATRYGPTTVGSAVPTGERVPSSADAASDGHPQAPPRPASDGFHRGQRDRRSKISGKSVKLDAASAEQS